MHTRMHGGAVLPHARQCHALEHVHPFTYTVYAACVLLRLCVRRITSPTPLKSTKRPSLSAVLEPGKFRAGASTNALLPSGVCVFSCVLIYLCTCTYVLIFSYCAEQNRVRKRMCMRSKAWLAASVSLRLARLPPLQAGAHVAFALRLRLAAPGLLAHALVTKQ
jgi:hypothetical protein